MSFGGIEFYGISLGGKLSRQTSVQGKISKTITETTSYTYQQSITQSYTINATEDCYYSYEKRGLFDLYVCQVYKVIYSETKTKRDQWYEEYDYTYTVTGYQLEEQNAHLTYVDDTLEQGYYRYYQYPEGDFYYSDNKASNVIYY